MPCSRGRSGDGSARIHLAVAVGSRAASVGAATGGTKELAAEVSWSRINAIMARKCSNKTLSIQIRPLISKDSHLKIKSPISNIFTTILYFNLN